MAEVNQYSVSHRELTELLIKKLDLHEGRWTLLLNLGIGTGGVQIAPDQTYPGVSVAVVNVGLQRQEEGVPIAPHAIVVDASEVNPAPTKKKGSKVSDPSA